MVEEMR